MGTPTAPGGSVWYGTKALSLILLVEASVKHILERAGRFPQREFRQALGVLRPTHVASRGALPACRRHTLFVRRISGRGPRPWLPHSRDLRHRDARGISRSDRPDPTGVRTARVLSR